VALNRFTLAVFALALIHPSVARSQPVAVEASQTGGYSTEEIAAVATQVRVFGELPASRLRFNVEAAWGKRSAQGSDVFGTAYPYEGPLQVIEAYGERTFLPGRALFGVKAGRYRTPFGISSASDHAYMGFLRAPLIRYNDYWALSNTFLEHGVDVIAGTPHLSLEASFGVPADVGEAIRRDGLNTVLRGQGAFRSMVVGVSHIRTQPYQNPRFAHGDAVFSGVDLRWMHDGVQARGEWIVGRPFDNRSTTGGYVDLIVHRPSMGPVTAVLRAERLAYEAPAPRAMAAERYTLGTRIRIIEQLAAQIGLVHQSRQIPQRRPTALDLGLTYSLRR
jgi:hypothetical protein